MLPTASLRLQVIERVVTVLKAITAGASYFYTPAHVSKGFVAEPQGYPVYQVLSESGGEIELYSDQQNAESFYIAIVGKVQDASDVVTKIENALRDVRKAINEDFKPGMGAGSLINLASDMRIEAPPDIEYEFEGVGFFGYFSQRVRFQVYGEFGEI
jgi:hypothetical protein